MGGRNKYLINGKNAQQSTVQNLFHSVQLNVNNPHFLIMQGRITKVLNMKPHETLGMIEEAAGTRMFEAKKQAALKTIEKKQTKVEEINKVRLDIESKQRQQLLSWRASAVVGCTTAEPLCRNASLLLLPFAWETVVFSAPRASSLFASAICPPIYPPSSHPPSLARAGASGGHHAHIGEAAV